VPVATRALRLALAIAVPALLTACERRTEDQGKAPARREPVAAVTPLPKPPPAKYLRDAYGKLDDCVADWGFAAKCTPVPADAPERSRGAVYFGPIYSSALRAESQLAARREAVEQGYAAQLDETPSDRSVARIEINS